MSNRFLFGVADLIDRIRDRAHRGTYCNGSGPLCQLFARNGLLLSGPFLVPGLIPERVGLVGNIEFAIPMRIDGQDALGQRRMRGGQRLHETRNTLGKKGMTDFGCTGIVHDRTVLESTDPFQCARDPVRVAGVLDRRGIRQIFPLPADRGLDQAAEKSAGKADDHQPDAKQKNLPPAFAASSSAPRIRGGTQNIVARQANDENAVQHTHQADVEPHVAVKDMAELMGDDTLQLLAVQMVDQSLGHPDDCIARCETGRKGIDARFTGEDIHRRCRYAGRDRHFFHYV